jgi:hypothetical protein
MKEEEHATSTAKNFSERGTSLVDKKLGILKGDVNHGILEAVIPISVAGYPPDFFFNQGVPKLDMPAGPLYHKTSLKPPQHHQHPSSFR